MESYEDEEGCRILQFLHFICSEFMAYPLSLMFEAFPQFFRDAIHLFKIKHSSNGLEERLKLTIMFNDDVLDKIRIYGNGHSNGSSCQLRWKFHSSTRIITFPNESLADVIMKLIELFSTVSEGRFNELTLKQYDRQSSGINLGLQIPRSVFESLFMRCNHARKIIVDCHGSSVMTGGFMAATHVSNLFVNAESVIIPGDWEISEDFVRNLSSKNFEVSGRQLSAAYLRNLVENWVSQDENVSPSYTFTDVSESVLTEVSKLFRMDTTNAYEWAPGTRIYESLVDHNGNWPFSKLVGFQIPFIHNRKKIASLVADFVSTKIFFFVSVEPSSKYPILHRVLGRVHR